LDYLIREGITLSTLKTETETEAVVVERMFKAPREAVFEAWTQADHLKSWFGPEGVRVTDISVDFCLGGTFRVEMTLEDGEVVVHSGKYLEIAPPRRLVYSWILDGQTCGGSEGLYAETTVTVEFEERDGGTFLRLRHEGLPTEQSRKGHRWGWSSSLEKLAKSL